MCVASQYAQTHHLGQMVSLYFPSQNFIFEKNSCVRKLQRLQFI
jgi:hypothetical protein